MEEERPKRMALIASQGTLDWAYPTFILASNAVAMEMPFGPKVSRISNGRCPIC